MTNEVRTAPPVTVSVNPIGSGAPSTAATADVPTVSTCGFTARSVPVPPSLLKAKVSPAGSPETVNAAAVPFTVSVEPLK